ncbi:hypothetical protein NQ152_10500 [Microbacterium sp. zg.B48]|uniref:hypothetical protein n=1 Tax=Microbacterium sp. zg.B48 TaxID=2969408 RepID=UPI00214AABCB|nr:hypothetical protein [Microbacterium sp. zg.B48]MCR2763932.1 hypothetical protein [Microbacterium sp. zg.B48]
MRRAASIPDLSLLVRSRTALLAGGWTERSIRLAVGSGRLRVIRRGAFMDAQDAATLWPEAWHLAHVIAVAREATGDGVISHESAGVAWSLPLYRHRPLRVHVTTPAPSRISSGADVMRHVAPLPASDIVVRHGIRCTSLERTVFDMVRTLGPDASVAAADAAERQFALRGRVWDEDAVACWRRSMRERVTAASGARGIRQARWVTAFADGRAQLPGESVSRLQLMRLGFDAPQLQVPVAGPAENTYFVDFGLTDVRAFGEFDGKDKYLDVAMRRGVALEKILLEEKRREDWIRGTTQWRFARWEDEHSVTPQALAARLASFGIRAPG